MKTISAIFDTERDARQAQSRLYALGVTESDVRLTGGGKPLADDDKSWWESIKDFFTFDEDDRSLYGEGLRRGGCLLTSRVQEDQADAAIEALRDCNPIDLDTRAAEWRSEGWGNTARDRADTEETIPVVREQLKAGKRAVNRGNVRVTSRIVDEPVHEDVKLRKERVEDEDVVVRKFTGGRTEAVDDTLRHTEVDVDDEGDRMPPPRKSPPDQRPSR